MITPCLALFEPANRVYIAAWPRANWFYSCPVLAALGTTWRRQVRHLSYTMNRATARYPATPRHAPPCSDQLASAPRHATPLPRLLERHRLHGAGLDSCIITVSRDRGCSPARGEGCAPLQYVICPSNFDNLCGFGMGVVGHDLQPRPVPPRPRRAACSYWS